MNQNEIFKYQDRIVLNNNLQAYEQPIGDVRDQYMKRYVFEDGSECLVYYPENIDSNTKISTYYPGSGMKADWYSQLHGSRNMGIQDYLMSQGSDQIVVMPHANNGNYERDYIGAKMTSVLQESYNLSSTNYSWAGFSAGGPPCIESAATYMRMNPDCGPQVIVGVDGYGSYSDNAGAMAAAVADDFKRTGSIIFSIDSKYKGDYLTSYAKAGINVVRVTSDTPGVIDTKNGDTQSYYRSGQHVAINQDYFRDGIFEFNAQTGLNLPREGYTYSVYRDGKWVQIDVSEIDTFEKLNEFFGNDVSLSGTTSINERKFAKLSSLENFILKSDEDILTAKLNEIRGVIRNTAFLKGNYSATEIQSTTRMPSEISSVVAKTFNTSANLLEKIAKETESFAQAAESIKAVDLNLQNAAQDLQNGATSAAAITTAAAATGAISQTPQNQPSQQTAPNLQNSAPTQQGATNPQQYYSAPQQQAPSTNQPETNHEKPQRELTNSEKEFPKFEEIYSDDNRVVYSFNDNCKIIIYKENDKVIGIEHYYDFGSKENLDKSINTIMNNYIGYEGLDKITQCDRYVKVIFNENAYKNMTVSQMKEVLSSLTEVKK